MPKSQNLQFQRAITQGERATLLVLSDRLEEPRKGAPTPVFQDPGLECKIILFIFTNLWCDKLSTKINSKIPASDICL